MAKRPMARDIVEVLRGNVDPRVLEVLVGLAEYQNKQRDQIKQLADLVNTCVDEITKLQRVIERATGMIDTLRKRNKSLFDEEDTKH